MTGECTENLGESMHIEICKTAKTATRDGGKDSKEKLMCSTVDLKIQHTHKCVQKQKVPKFSTCLYLN